MSLYKRGDVWWLKVPAPSGGKPIRRSTGTTDKKAAQEYHDKLKADLWKEARLGVKPPRTWDEAALRWLQEMKHKRSMRHDIQRIAWFTKRLRGETIPIARRRIQDLVELELMDGKASASTKNIYVSLVRSMMRRAQKRWEWIDSFPAYESYRMDNERSRWLSDEEARRLLAALPDHWRPVVIFALATGLRRMNALRAQWSWLVEGQPLMIVPADVFKTAVDHPVPLNMTALAVLDEMRGKHPQAVFTYPNGRPMRWFNTGQWKEALKKAGIIDFRFHDLRHTWASWQIQLGTPPWMLQQMAGWKTGAMVRRYAHLNPAHLLPHAAAIDGRLAGLGHKAGHSGEAQSAETLDILPIAAE